MALHLIESRSVARSSARSRSGTLASIALHIMFATAVLTLATKAPLHLPSKPIEEHTIYTQPPATPQQPTSQPPSSHSNSLVASSIVPTNIPVIDIANVPVEIPSVGTTISTDVSIGVSHGSSTSNNNRGTSTGDPNAVLDNFQVDKPVIALPGAQSPKYPDALRAAGIQDTVLATFVVDTLGRVEPASFSVTNTPRAAFISSVHDALMSTKFKPAEAQGHRVRQRVLQAFVFSLTR